MNSQLVEHLESASDSQSTATLASVLINLGNAEIGLGRHQAALAIFTRAGDLVANVTPAIDDLAVGSGIDDPIADGRRAGVQRPFDIAAKDKDSFTTVPTFPAGWRLTF